MILFYTKLKKLRIVFRISYRKFRCECSIYISTIAIWNRFVTSARFWLVGWLLKMHSWLEIKCQTECNNDYDKNKGHEYRFLCDLTFSFRTSNWNNHVYTILHIFEQEQKKKTDDLKISFMGWVTFSFMEIFLQIPPPFETSKNGERGGDL